MVKHAKVITQSSIYRTVKPLTVVTPLSVSTTVKVNEKPLSVVITVNCITSSRDGLFTEVDPNEQEIFEKLFMSSLLV